MALRCGVDLALVRDALRKRKIADKAHAAAEAAEHAALDAEALVGLTSKARTAARSGSRRFHPAHQAILDAGLTVEVAAALCGTTGPVLSKAWADGKQLRPARPEWRRTLARLRVPRSVWRDR